MLLEALLNYKLFSEYMSQRIALKFIEILSYINFFTYTICLLYGSGLLKK